MDETKTINYKDTEIDVQRNGTLVFNGKELKQFAMPNGRVYACVRNKDIGKNVLVSVSRAVAMAFCECPGNFDDYQVDHIDNDLAHNSVSNLRWMTRKQNNSRKHARQMKSEHAKYTRHNGEAIFGTNKKTGETCILGIDGYEVAAKLGCSHVLVYNALNKDIPYVKTAKGWKLEWVPVDIKKSTEA